MPFFVSDNMTSVLAALSMKHLRECEISTRRGCTVP
jgi:hypothetical protein